MEDTQQMQAILAKMEQNNRQQLLFTKILCGLCAAAVICTLVLMIVVSGAAKELVALAEPLQALTAQVQGLAAQAQNVMTDLGMAAEELSKADFSGMVNQVDTLVKNSQSAVTEAVKKMDTIDIDALNKAIKDLAAIVEPLAKVSKFFG